jgi:hypothetical protein
LAAPKQTIKMPRLMWRRLIIELRTRGQNRRESGAFLLGRAGAKDGHIVGFICYDDLDPKALDQGTILFHSVGLNKLWKICSEKKCEVLADIHTHPTDNVLQSSVDKKNPMIPVLDHVGLIIPNFANTSTWSLSGVGMYVFKGGMRWESFHPNADMAPLRLSLW